jgi:hypothetical protein
MSTAFVLAHGVAPDRHRRFPIWRSSARTARCRRAQGEAQAAVKRHLEQAGHGYLCSSDYREVVETLKV